MINPYLAADLRHASKVFRRSGRPILASACFIELGRLADSTDPDEAPAIHLVNMATGGPIHA